MDCCNFMPYRPPYYGTPYYENIPYHAGGGDYYGGHPYQDYYGTASSPYYAQSSWQCAAPFTDYVYNPKEARIRKAMREASRERALGVTSMPSPRGARRSSAWTFSEEEQLMMTPSHAMRGIIGSPMCTSPGFPISTTGNGPFMQSMHYNNKHVHHIPPHTTNTYMQPNSIPQLPPPSEIWHPYEDPLRSASRGPPYMMPPSQLPPQTYQQAEIPPGSAMPPQKPKIEPEAFEDQPPHTNENVPPNLEEEKMPVFESKVDSIQPLIETRNIPQPQPQAFLPGPYGENMMTTPQPPQQQQQRGRYIEKVKTENFPVDHAPFARAPPYGASPNLAHTYYKDYVRKYLESTNCDVVDVMGETGDGFSYVTYPHPQVNQYDYVSSVSLNDILFLKNFLKFLNCSGEVLNLSKKQDEV